MIHNSPEWATNCDGSLSRLLLSPKYGWSKGAVQHVWCVNIAKTQQEWEETTKVIAIVGF